MITDDFQRAINQEQNALRSMLASLTPVDREQLMAAVRPREKSLLVAMVLCLLGGAHQLYFSDYKMQVLFWVTLGGLGIWWFFELISLPKRVKLYNVRVKRRFVQAFIEKVNRDSATSSTQTVVLDRFQPYDEVDVF